MNLIRSETRTINVEGGKFSAYLAQPSLRAPKVLVYHAWWGLTPFFQEWAARLAGEGFQVLAPDLYDGKTVSTIPDAEGMEAYRVSGRPAFIAPAALRWMLEQPSDYPGLGLVGFSMGGEWSLDLAGRFPDAIKAVVLYYGSGDTDFAKLRASFQGHFGGLDEWVPESNVEYLEKGMNAHGVEHQFFKYPDAEHWFVETNRPEYRAEDTALAWQRTVKFLHEKLA